MKRLIRSMFDSLGLEVRKKQPPAPSYDYFRNEQMILGLQRSFERGLRANTIIDLGAAAGSWTLSAAEYWPEANYVLFEPLEERKTELESLCARHKNFYYVPAAAGEDKGHINFHVAGDLDGSGVMDNEDGSGVNIRSVNVTSVDSEVKKLQLKGPYIVKLDTHGFEVPIIKGCSEILKDVSLFIIECYGFQIAKDSLLFWEMCEFLSARGFRLIDIVDVFNRPKDHAFWQCDAFFAPSNLELFKDNYYR